MSVERIAVVTGANKGIGFGIVKGLMQQFDGIIYLTARDEIRGLNALETLKKMPECKHPEKIHYYKLDILDNDYIQKFAKHIENQHGGLDILINNAAIAYKVSSIEPFEIQAKITIQTNYFALINICNILFPLLRSHSRVVNVSSSCGHLCHVTQNKLKNELLNENLTEEQLSTMMNEFVKLTSQDKHTDVGWPNSTYAVSKIGVTKLSFIQHNKLSKDENRVDIIVNPVHPGYCDTDMSSHKGPLSIDQGARSSIFCALLPPNVKEPRGQFVWDNCNIVNWADSVRPPCLSDTMIQNKNRG